jgi:hypothetical protein
VKINKNISILEGKIDTKACNEWFSALQMYFEAYNFGDAEKMKLGTMERSLISKDF